MDINKLLRSELVRAVAQSRTCQPSLLSDVQNKKANISGAKLEVALIGRADVLNIPVEVEREDSEQNFSYIRF